MRKIKYLIAGFISAMAFVLFAITGGEVNAATTALFDASTITTGENNSQYVASGIELSEDADVMSIKGNGAVKYQTATIGGYSLSICTNGNDKEYTFVVGDSDINVTIIFGACDSSSYKSVAWSLKQGSTSVDSGTTSTSAVSSTTVLLEKETTYKLACSGRRCALFYVGYELPDTNVYNYSFNLNGGTGTAIPSGTVQISGTESERTITLPPTDAVKNKNEFAGWSDGTNTYSAGDTYVISGHTTFTAVWNSTVSFGSNTVLNISDLSVGSEEGIIDGSIFSFISALTIESNSKTVDGKTFTKRVKFSGAGSLISNSILVKAPSKGKLLVYAISGKSGETRTLGLYNSSFTGVDTTGFTNDGTDATGYVYDIASAGDYYVASTSGGYNVYYLEFIPETVTALQQEAKVENSTFVRFIFIISNATDIEDYDFTNTLHLVLDAGDENSQTLDRTATVYNKVTNNGVAYTAEVNGNNYTFDNSINTNDVYIVYVVEFTTEYYLNHTISAKLDYKTDTYSTTPYTFK